MDSFAVWLGSANVSRVHVHTHLYSTVPAIWDQPLHCLIKFIYWRADMPRFSAMWILVVLGELQGQLFCCVLETELLHPYLIWTLVLCCISQTLQTVLEKGWCGCFGGLGNYLSKITAAREVDSKVISLPFTMSSVTLELDLNKGCREPARTQSFSYIQKSEKQYFFLFNIGRWCSVMRLLYTLQDESVIWVGMAV